MATEKILNTKVLLRYDTLANWQKTDITNGGANYVPKKGEACVYEIPTGASVDGVKNPPAIMIKVGDGTSKVSALPWIAATAADVYAWAKKSGITVEEGTGDYVTGITWSNDKIVVTKASFDTAMSATSTNAVQNKVVKAAIDAAEKAAKDYSDSNEKTSSVSNTADKVIKVTPKTTGNNTDYALDFQYDNSGNVKFEETTNGLKATVSISDVKVDKAVYADEASKATNDGAGNNIVSTYATKAEIEAQEALWAKDTVTTVTGKDAIKVQDTDTDDTSHDYKVELVINAGTPGNVTLTQDGNGLKANTTPEAIGAKSKQTAVTDKITDKAHVLDSLTQNENGEISYEVRTLTPDDIGAKSKQTTVSKTLTGAQVVGTISQNENGVITVTDRTITAADLGLDSAMHFIGVSATAPVKGPGNRELQSGDVYLNSANNTEYVWADSKWNELGDEGTAGSHALKTTTIPGGLLIESTAKLDGSGAINHGTPTGAKAHTSTANNGSNPLEQGATLKLPTVTTDSFGHVIGTGTEDVILPSVSIDFKANTFSDGTGVTYNVKIDGASAIGSDALTSKNYVDDAIARVAGKDGNGKEVADTYKVKQTAVSDPTANGKSLTFIDSISQNTEGVITATKKNVNLDAYALKADLPEIPDVVITETKGALGTGGTIFVSGKLAADTVTGHTISQPMFGLTQQGDIEFVTDKQTIEADQATTKAVSFAIKDKAVTAEKTAAYTTENSDGTHTASTEVWVLYGGSATENI